MAAVMAAGREARVAPAVRAVRVRRAVLADMPDFPRIFGIEDEYAQAMRQAELAWVRATVTGLRDGTFPWPTTEELKEGGFMS